MRKLQAELDYRFGELRNKIAKDKSIAAAHGDRSENAEYKAACEEYRKNDNRIQYLFNMLSTAEIVEESDAKGEFGLGKSGIIKFLDEDEKEEIKLVTTLDRDLDKMLISIESELGKSLIGKKKGDIVEISAPGGAYKVEVMEVFE